MSKRVKKTKATKRKANGWFPCKLRILRGRPTENADGVKLKLEVDLNKRATLGVAELFVRRME